MIPEVVKSGECGGDWSEKFDAQWFFPLRFAWRDGRMYVCKSLSWLPDKADWEEFPPNATLNLTVRDDLGIREDLRFELKTEAKPKPKHPWSLR